MKKPEEYLKDSNIVTIKYMKSVISLDGKGSDIDKLIRVIKQAQKDAYNQALQDAAEEVVVEIIDHEELLAESITPHDGKWLILPIYGVDMESILKLKMK